MTVLDLLLLAVLGAVFYAGYRLGRWVSKQQF